ncbi:MAG: calcium-binding protein [Synechococcales bacterium]|nr:calcium-binding protein [Synechococcales bacterium]
MTTTAQGTEFQINEFVTDDQDSPMLGFDAQGNFVVTWESDGQDGDGEGIFARRYRADGTPLSAEFRVNITTNNDQDDPAIAVADDGRFVIVWEDESLDGSSEGIFAQRYTATGTAIGPEFRVNTTATNTQDDPAIALNADGSFIITWVSTDQDGSQEGVYLQRYDSNGTPLGVEFRVNTTTDDDQENPAIATDGNGNFVIVWESDDQDGDGRGIFAQRFDSSGNPVGNEFQVSTTTEGNQDNPTVAMNASGNFVVVWESDDQDGSGSGIFAQRYSATGTPVGSEFQVNNFGSGNQVNPTAAIDDAGNILIAWNSDSQDGSGNGVYARQFAPNGSPAGDEFRVNSETDGDQLAPAAGIGPNGQAAIVWQSAEQDSDENGIFAQRYTVNSSIPTVPDTDPIVGTSGDDRLNGSNDNDLIRGRAGDDRIVGRAGDDTLRGGGGNDNLSGGRGNDRLFGGGADDLLQGRGGDDTLRGGGGDDTLRGNGGNDSLTGNGGNDALVGGNGDDVLTGGLGDDTLAGNGGADQFLLEVNGGTDTIQDFRSGTDTLAISGDLDFGDFDIERQGSSTAILFEGETVAILSGVQPTEISADDVIVL